jgi:ribose 5-phosphate isomerase B
MKVAIGSDHAGLGIKKVILDYLAREGHQVEDQGTFSEESCDYPVFAREVGRRVSSGECERGILICATGNGMAIASNKIKGVRAAVCNDLYTARFSRLHNDANVLCLGERVVGPGLALEIARVWMETGFEGGRHLKRLQIIQELENQGAD